MEFDSAWGERRRDFATAEIFLSESSKDLKVLKIPYMCYTESISKPTSCPMSIQLKTFR